MTYYENRRDRIQQAPVAEVVRQHFCGETTSHVAVLETPEILRHHHDVDIFKDHRHVAIGEIKCRNYDWEFFQREGWMVSWGKLLCLNEAMAYEEPRQVYLFLRTKGGFVFKTSLFRIVLYVAKTGKKLEFAPEKNTRLTDHGQRQRVNSDPCVIIPFEVLQYIGQTNAI